MQFKKKIFAALCTSFEPLVSDQIHQCVFIFTPFVWFVISPAIPFEMASLLDSEAQFRQRAKECKLSELALQDLSRLGVTSFGLLAYSFGQPGQNIADDAFNNWVRQEVNPGVTLADCSALKRLLFESHTLVMASLKEQVVAPDSAATRKVPPTERDSKMQHVRNSHAGLLIEGPLDPGHSLLDACAQMHHTNEIKYLAPERCVSRMHEITHQKSPTKQVEIDADRLIVKDKSEVPDEAAHSALQVKEALERRGVGLVFADLVTFTTYSKYLAALFAHMHRDPHPGYARTSVSQIVAADKAVWAKLLEEGVKPRRDSDGTLPVDVGLMKALESYAVSFSLLPPPQQKKSAPVAAAPKPKAAVKTTVFQKPSKGKGKSKGSNKGPRVPYQIIQAGGVGKTPDGSNICFKYNIEGCDDAADGSSCRRGKHCCAKCFANHSLKDHS